MAAKKSKTKMNPKKASSRSVAAKKPKKAATKVKRKSGKKKVRARSAPKRPATKTPPRKPTKKRSSTKKVVAKKVSAKRVPVERAPAKLPAKKRVTPVTTPPTPALPQAPARSRASSPSPKTFADHVRDFDAGTGVWFTVAGGIEHAVIQRRGGDGAVVIRTDAGVTELVPSGNLFETADKARAARSR